MTFDVAVVGGGIVGTACARELANAGLRVAICESSDCVGGGATAAGMGHIAVMDDSEAQFALTSFSQAKWRELAQELPADCEYISCGSLWVAADADEFAEVERKWRYYMERGTSAEKLDAQQLAEAEPGLRRGLAGALLLADDAVCYPPCVARYLSQEVVRKGGEVLLGSKITRVKEGIVKSDDGFEISAAAIVLATGTALTKVIPDLPIHPRKGHLLITDRYPGFLRHQLIELGYLKSAHAVLEDSVAFNAQPRKTGQILIGSSRQFGEEDSQIENAMLQRMLRRAVEYMPALGAFSGIRSWTGFRASTPDKLPLIGLCPGYQGVYLAGGHEGLGISTSLGTAQLMADQILGRPPALDGTPYQPGRTFADHA